MSERLFKRIKDWAVSITAFRTGDVIPVDGPSGTAKMGKDDLLKETGKQAVAVDKKLIPSVIPIRAGLTYTESTMASTDTTATQPVESVSAISSGLVDVSEGDVIDVTNGYRCYFYNNSGRTSASTLPATCPSGYNKALIVYKYSDSGSGLDAVVRIVPYSAIKKVGIDVVNFVCAQVLSNASVVPTSKSVFESLLFHAKAVTGTNLYDDSIAKVGKIVATLSPGDDIQYSDNNDYRSEAVIVAGASKLTFKYVRKYVFANSAGKAITYSAFATITEATTVNVPKDAFYFCASIPNEDAGRAQINAGESLLEYSKFSLDFEYNGISFVRYLTTLFAYTKIASKVFGFRMGTLADSSNWSRANVEVKLSDGISYVISASQDSPFNTFKSAYYYNNDGTQGTAVPISNDSIKVVGSPTNVSVKIQLSKKVNGSEVNLVIDDLSRSFVVVDWSQNSYAFNSEIYDKVSSDESCSLYDEGPDAEVDDESAKVFMKRMAETQVVDNDDSKTFEVSPNSLKLISLHRRSNNGYDADNDVFMPNARKNFSDVGVFDEKGNAIPYRFIFSGNVDVLSDSRLHISKIARKNSHGEIITAYGGVVVKSADDGVTWTTVEASSGLAIAELMYMDPNDVIFVGSNDDGKIYRSEYPYTTFTLSLDVNASVGYECTLLPYDMAQHPDGELFYASYQLQFATKFFKSVDGGLTWSVIKTDTTYQHCHGIFVDTNQNPVAIYFGMDGGGGVFKTTDKGVTFVDLRAQNPNMPQATDFGVVWANSDKRILAGETDYVGGNLLTKTTDDATYTTLLNGFGAIHPIAEVDGVLYAGTVRTQRVGVTGLLRSKDAGETWESIYTSQYDVEMGANNGFRSVSKIGNELWIYSQMFDNNKRIINGGDNYYAQIMIEIPEGVEEITVRSGCLAYYASNITNKFDTAGDIAYFPFNEKYGRCRGKVNGEWSMYDYGHSVVEGGKSLSVLFPPIVSVADRFARKMDGRITHRFKCSLDAEGFHIGFWIKAEKTTTTKMHLVVDNSNDLYIDGNSVKYNSTIVGNVFRAIVYGAWQRVDINVYGGVVDIYQNGELEQSVDYGSDISFGGNVRFCEPVNPNCGNCVQHFAVDSSVKTAAEILKMFYAGL